MTVCGSFPVELSTMPKGLAHEPGTDRAERWGLSLLRGCDLYVGFEAGVWYLVVGRDTHVYVLTEILNL